MPGPVTTLGTPLNVSGGGGSVSGAGGSGGSIVGDLGAVAGQVDQQTQQFGTLLKDPGFTGQSEMGAMLKLQREMAKESMLFSTLSNVMQSRKQSCQNCIQNMK